MERKIMDMVSRIRCQWDNLQQYLDCSCSTQIYVDFAF